MSREENITLKYKHGEKSMKVLFLIYADLKCLLEKISTCHNNLQKSSTTKINDNTPSGYSMFTHCQFDAIKNELYRGKDCMERFCKDLKEHATKIINYEEKKEKKVKKESYIVSKKYVKYVKKDLVQMMIVKNIIKSEIVANRQESMEKVLMIFAI